MTLLVLDLEYNQPTRRIIQVGVVRVDTTQGHIEPLFESLVNPEEPLDAYITRLTGISQEDVDSAPTQDTVLDAFWQVVKNLPGPVTLGGWGDDAAKLLRDTQRSKITPPPIIEANFMAMWDVFRLQGDHKTSPKTRGLKAVMKHYGVTFRGSHHNALTDAWATAEVLLKMRQEVLALLGIEQG